MSKRPHLRVLLATVVSLFLFLQLGLITRNGCQVEETSLDTTTNFQDALRVEEEKRVLALLQEKRQDFVERMATSDVDRAAARIYGVPRDTKEFMTIGIPSIQRTNVTYLENTVASLSKHASATERKEVVIVVFLSDLDETSRNATAAKLGKLFTREISEGFLHVIKAPKSFYPDLNNLERTFNDPEKRVKWRSKQNFDYAYLMKYSQPLSTYYMQLEDDVITMEGYVTRVKTAIKTIKKKNWSCLEFSKLGFIGKLFPSADIGRLAEFLMIFFDQQPVDLLFPFFFRIMTQPKPLQMKPSLFQHMGAQSSFDNDKNPLKDNTFLAPVKKFKGDNPVAEVSTNLLTFEEYTIERSYNVDDEDGYFWGKTPRSGDTINILFKELQDLGRVVIVTGSTEHPGDMLRAGVVEVGATLQKYQGKEDVCADMAEVGHFEKGVADLKLSDNLVPFKVACIRITVSADQKTWLIVNEIAVFKKK